MASICTRAQPQRPAASSLLPPAAEEAEAARSSLPLACQRRKKQQGAQHSWSRPLLLQESSWQPPQKRVGAGEACRLGRPLARLPLPPPSPASPAFWLPLRLGQAKQAELSLCLLFHKAPDQSLTRHYLAMISIWLTDLWNEVSFCGIFDECPNLQKLKPSKSPIFSALAR